jgi:hypothetical protein
MHQCPQAVWNQIAKMEPLDPFWRKAMEMPPEKQEDAYRMVDALAERVTKDPTVILAHRVVAPLLMENEAISSFIMETHQGALRASLPEVISTEEAVSLATAEYRLTKQQQSALRQTLLLTRRATTPVRRRQPQKA